MLTTTGSTQILYIPRAFASKRTSTQLKVGSFGNDGLYEQVSLEVARVLAVAAEPLEGMNLWMLKTVLCCLLGFLLDASAARALQNTWCHSTAVTASDVQQLRTPLTSCFTCSLHQEDSGPSPVRTVHARACEHTNNLHKSTRTVCTRRQPTIGLNNSSNLR